MLKNMSTIPQVYYTPVMEPFEVLPGCCFDPALLGGGVTLVAPLQEFGSIETYLENHPAARLMFVRSGGLGDVICLTPVLDTLLKRYPGVSITVATENEEVFRYWEPIKAVSTRRAAGVSCDVGFLLNDVLELDYQQLSVHAGKPRLQIYTDVLGMKKIIDPIFRFPFSQEDNVFADMMVPRNGGTDRVIGIQVAGASPTRSLPIETVRLVVNGLVSEGHQVVILHNARVDFEGERIINLSGQTTLHQLVAVIHKLDLMVTMDSGCMWVAHTTQTPLVAILGPTRPQEKTCYHRNCVSLETNKWIDCEACFESLEACNRGIDCLRKADPKRILDCVLEAMA